MTSVARVLVVEERMHARRDAVGVFSDGPWVRRIAIVADDDAVPPVGGALAREYEDRPVRRRDDVVHATCVGDNRVGDDRLRGIADVDREHDVAAAAGPEIGVLAVGMQPQLLGAEPRAWQTSDDRDGATHVALT